MVTESRVSLRTGPDLALKQAVCVLGLLAIVGFLFSPAELVFRGAGVLASLVTFWHLKRSLDAMDQGDVHFFADGKLRWVNQGPKAGELNIRRYHWLSSRYALMHSYSKQGKRSFLISRTLQLPGHYQATSSWLRLGASITEQDKL